MIHRVSVTFGVVAFLFAVTVTAQPSVTPAAGGYGRVPAYQGYPTAAGRVPYPRYLANPGGPAGAYWAGGRWYGGWSARSYYAPGAAGYGPYWYAGTPYFYANPASAAWYPGYGPYYAPAPAPIPAVAPPAPAQSAPAEELVLKGVDFETDSAQLRPESTAILDGVADTIRRCNCSAVAIRGYTDSVGDREYNQELSEQRANAVIEYLERHGVPAGILTSRGFGEEDPIASNTTADGRAQNRRVTVQFSAPAGTQRRF